MQGPFENLCFEAPFVVQSGEVRSLHFTYGEVQSSMRIDSPDELHVDYTRTMMGFLLLQPEPRRITMIGLGGGSLVKFCHRHLAACHITVVENNPAVVALRNEFAIPEDGPRLKIVTDDGAAFLRRSIAPADALLVDAFDRHGQPRSLCSQAFYDDCRRALRPGGVMAVNLHVDDTDFQVHTQRIGAAFDGNVVLVMAPEKCNCIAFAVRDRAVAPETMTGDQWKRALAPAARQQLKGDFDHIGWHACRLLP